MLSTTEIMPEKPQLCMTSVVSVESMKPSAIENTKVRAITTGLQLLTQIAQNNPTSVDVVDYDKAAMEVLEAVMFPASCYRDPRAVAAIRDQRNKLMQQERTAENAPKLARAAASLAKAPESGSILHELMGGEGAVQ